MPTIIKAPKTTIWGSLAKLSTRTLLIMRADHRLGLARRYRKTAELILIERGVPLGEISVVGQKPGRPPKEEEE